MKTSRQITTCYYNKKLNGFTNRYREGINTGCRDFVVGMLKSSWGWATEGSQFDYWQGREFNFSPKP
jgi:hypothetical protein